MSIRDGLVAEYCFAGGADDTSGCGRHGVVRGATLTADRFGRPDHAYHFDGVDDYIEIAPPPAFPSDGLSVSSWVRYEPREFRGWTNCIVAQDDGNDEDQSRRVFQLSTDSGHIVWHRMVCARDPMCRRRVRPGTWYHVVAVHDHGMNRLYVDGFLHDMVEHRVWTHGSQPMHIGRKGTPEPHFHFHGAIDDVRVYDRALSDDEVRELLHDGGWEVAMPKGIPVEGDPLSGRWGRDGVVFLDVTYDGDCRVTGQIMAGRPSNMAGIAAGTFNRDTAQLRLEGDARHSVTGEAVAYVIEGMLDEGEISVSATFNDYSGNFMLTRGGTRLRLSRNSIRSQLGALAFRLRRWFLSLGAGLMVVLLAGSAGEARGQVQQHAGHLLGTVDFPITCSAQAQTEFNQAVALLHHMTYPQAREAFQRVAAIDPRCAMAHWGIAMTLFQPLWPTRPQPEALQRGWEAVQQAKSLQPPTERERLFVAAAEAFFLEPASSDYWLRIRRWEEATQKAYASLPRDTEAAVFYALAHLAAAPSNTISGAHSDRAAEILLRVHERNPDHPGDMHYLVHANDAPGRERESLEITRKYEAVAPRNPHALHMPTHIYTRLGDWNGVIRGNLRAAAAALEHPAGAHREFVWDEFPHAIEYLVYAYLQKGADDVAAAELKRLRATARLEPTFKTAFHLASTQARYALERRAWNEAALLVPREPATLDWDRFTWPEAVVRFAQGLGAAHLGKVHEARAAGTRLEELEAATRKVGEDLFARNIQVLRLELNALLAHVEGQRESSVALMREAAELEASTPKHAVTPGPTLPAHELLGDLLMEQKQPAEALAAYKRSMELYPRRFNGLLGAARAARALGDESLARTFYRELLDVAAGGTRQPALKEAETYVAQRR